MEQFVSIIMTVVIMTFSMNVAAAKNNAADGFNRLKSLVGEWHSKTADGQEASISYQLISGGTALMESITYTNEPGMVTVYHLNGDKLMMTHYCSINNQPRMLAAAAMGDVKKLNFTFVDGTNMAKPTDAHMHSLAFTFQDNDHITQDWSMHHEGKEMPVTFNLERKK